MARGGIFSAAAVYAILNGCTAIASLVTFGHTARFTQDNCVTKRTMMNMEPFLQSQPCDFTRYFIYLIASTVAIFSAYVSMLITMRSRPKKSGWAPAAYGFTYSLAAYLIVLFVGWAPGMPGSVTGVFAKDLHAAGSNWATLMSEDTIYPWYSVASSKATIILIHVTA
jgi:hypothetical protein